MDFCYSQPIDFYIAHVLICLTRKSAQSSERLGKEFGVQGCIKGGLKGLGQERGR